MLVLPFCRHSRCSSNPCWSSSGSCHFRLHHVNLLYAIAQDIGYAFDRVQLKRGAYTPIAHGELESEDAELRKATLSLVTGKHALKMNVVGLPIDPEAVAANREAIQNVGKALESGVLKVELSKRE